STVGGAADGVLGFYTTSGEITLIQGWDWYAGAAANTVGTGRYDFQTVVTHELGHALGLGHSADSSSVLYGTVAAGVARRTLTVGDLNVRNSDDGADGLHAAVAPTAVGVPARVDSFPRADITVTPGHDMLAGWRGIDLLVGWAGRQSAAGSPVAGDPF